MSPDPHLDALLALDRPVGERARALRIGRWEIALRGLDDDLAAALDRRWGGFVGDDPGPRPRLSVDIYDAKTTAWIERWSPGDRYRLEATIRDGRLTVRSYHFGACADSARSWRVGLSEIRGEEKGRVLENITRYLVARVAVEDGGLAFHGAVVLRSGRAFVFLGPSRSGKTTLVSLAGAGTSLGDDFAILVPEEDGWLVPATPFDNSERAPASPVRDLFPAAGLWPIRQADAPRVETLVPPQSVATILGCAALPWAMPDLADEILAHAGKLAEDLPVTRLHFRAAPDFWELIDP